MHLLSSPTALPQVTTAEGLSATLAGGTSGPGRAAWCEKMVSSNSLSSGVNKRMNKKTRKKKNTRDKKRQQFTWELMANVGPRAQRATFACRMTQHSSFQLDLLSTTPHQCVHYCVWVQEARHRDHVGTVDFVCMFFHDVYHHCSVESQWRQITLWLSQQQKQCSRASLFWDWGHLGDESNTLRVTSGGPCKVMHWSGETGCTTRDGQPNRPGTLKRR